MSAQNFDEKNFALYSTKDGLTDNRITGIAQDEYGYLWISTQKGLNRFDGNSFLQCYSDSSRGSLPNDYIKQLKWLSKEQLGVSTGSGLHLIHPGTLQQRNLFVSPGSLNQSYIENNIQGVAGDAAGNIFILGSAGFYHFNRNDELIFRYDYYKKEDRGKTNTPFGRSDGIVMLHPGVLLLATTNGPYLYTVSTKELHPMGDKDNLLYRQVASSGGLVHFMHGNTSSFSVIAEGAKELAWFDLLQNKKFKIQTTLTGLDKLFGWRTKITGLNDSVFIITAQQKGFYLMHFNSRAHTFTILPELYLANYLCTFVLPDRHNRLWIGTSSGLLRQKRNTGNLEKLSLPVAINPLNQGVDIRMVTVANNKLFVATQGAGVYVFDRDSLQFLKRLDFSSFRTSGSANNVYSLLTYSRDSVYAGTYGPLIGINTHNYTLSEVNLPEFDYLHDWISWQFISSAKEWYVGTNKKNVFYYKPETEKKISLKDYSANPLFNILTPRYIAEDPQGQVWFGGHGASRFNVRTRQFDRLLDSFPKIKTARKEVNGIEFDRNGKMYFALVENGLAIYDPAKNTFEHITRSNGLPDNTIRALHLHDHKLWMGTESGLASYDIDTKQVSSFGLSDDMPEGAFTAYDFFYDSTGNQLYGGFHNTVIRFNPDSLSKSNAPPVFFIESIHIPGRDKLGHPAGKLVLSYTHNSIVVNLASINFEDAHLQQFAYRFVKSGDEAWQETGSQRSIIFSNLSPGEYRLQVKVFIKNNSWPAQVKEIIIIVRPPFWQRAWFIGLCSLLLIAGIWLALRARIKNVRQKANINTQLAELEMKGLHAQMNPHFIFNSLNSIKEMILEDEKQNASRYLSKFAQLIRSNLDHSKQTFISVQQCIDHLRQYLEMEKIRFEGFSYDIHISDKLPVEEIQMPPMLIQPLVENAIWHGLHPLQGEKKLDIRFFPYGSDLICEIEDNGIGIVKSRQRKSNLRPSHRSFGIANVRERLTVLNEKYKMNCSLTIIDKESIAGTGGSGTMVRLELTLLNHNA